MSDLKKKTNKIRPPGRSEKTGPEERIPEIPVYAEPAAKLIPLPQPVRTTFIPLLHLSLNWVLFSIMTLLFSYYLFPYYHKELEAVMDYKNLIDPSFHISTPNSMLGVMGFVIYLSDPVIWYYQRLIVAYRKQLALENKLKVQETVENAGKAGIWYVALWEFLKIFLQIPLYLGKVGGMMFWRWALKMYILFVSFRMIGLELPFFIILLIMVMAELAFWVIRLTYRPEALSKQQVERILGWGSSLPGILFQVFYSFYCTFLYAYMTVGIYDSIIRKDLNGNMINDFYQVTFAFLIIVGFMRAPFIHTAEDGEPVKNPAIIVVLNTIAYAVLYISFYMRYL